MKALHAKTLLACMLMTLVTLTGCEKNMSSDSTGTGSATSSKEYIPVNLTFFDVSTEDVQTPVDGRAGGENTDTDDEPSDLKKDNYFTQLSVAIFPLSGAGETRQFYQTREQEDFGKLKLSLPIGKYQMVAVAYKGSDAVKIEGERLVTFPNQKVTDMVAFNKTIEISKTTETFACGMQRIIAAFTLTSTDPSPATVVAVRGTFLSHCGYQYDPATTLTSSSREYSSIINLNPDNVGKKRTMTFYTLLDKISQDDVKITIELLDKNDNVLNRLDFQDVLLTQGKRTTYTGNLFSGDGVIEFVPNAKDDHDIPSSGGDKNFDMPRDITTDTHSYAIY